MKTINSTKGAMMSLAKSISVVASIALIGGLGFSGCNNSSQSDSSAVTQTQDDQIVVKQGVGIIEGSVNVDTTPQDRTLKSVSATSEVVAYNLSDNTQYTTMTDSSGNFTLTGLTSGIYQVVASSTSSTMRSVMQVDLTRETRATVTVNLQAAGGVKGKLKYFTSDTIVYVPGTSYLSTVDANGNFELINIPVGEVTLYVASQSYYQYETGAAYSTNVTVTAGETNILPEINPLITTVSSADFTTASVSLGLKHDGIDLILNNSVTDTTMKAAVTLKNAANENIEVNVFNPYKNTTSNYFKVQSVGVVPAGQYTLSVAIPDGETYTRTFTVQNKAAVFNYGRYNGFYKPSLGIAFAEDPATINVADITVTNSKSEVVTLSGVKHTVRDNWILEGTFDPAETYTVTLTGALAALAPDGVVYIRGTDSDLTVFSAGIQIDGLSVSSIYPYNGSTNVGLESSLGFSLNNAQALDLNTLKVTIGTEELTLANGGLTTSTNESWYSNSFSRSVSVHSKTIEYAKEHTMTISAKDALGNDISAASTFTTITPAIVGLLPDPADVLDNLDSCEGVLQAYFNVPVDPASGSVTLHDDTNNVDIALSFANGCSSAPTSAPMSINDTSTPYHIGFNPTSILPETTYTMSVSGYSADGYRLADRSVTFTTPKRHLLWTSVQNGDYARAQYLNNKVEFNFFGTLSDTEKAELTAGLTITSAGLAMSSDKSHPTPLALWETTPVGEKLILAFTIESGKSYEFDFGTSDAAKAMGMSGTKLTFMTEPLGGSSARVSNMFSSFSIGGFDVNEAGLSVSGYANLQVPQYVGSGEYSEVYNECYYGNIPSVATNKDISSWFSNGTNVTYSYASRDLRYHSGYYDQNNNYVSSYYSCDYSYSVNFSAPADYNSTASITITVPDSEVGEGVSVKSMTQTATYDVPVADGYRVEFYGNEVAFYFASPIDVENAKIDVTTNPAGINYSVVSSGLLYLNNVQYARSVVFTFDNPAYSVYQATFNGTLSALNVETNSTVSVGVDKTATIYTQADLEPLSVVSTPVATTMSSFVIPYNRYVDVESTYTQDANGTLTSMAFEVVDETNTTVAIANVASSSVYMNGTYIPVLQFYMGGDFNTSKTYTVTQTGDIKAQSSTQTLDAGYTNAIDLSDLMY